MTIMQRELLLKFQGEGDEISPDAIFLRTMQFDCVSEFRQLAQNSFAQTTGSSRNH